MPVSKSDLILIREIKAGESLAWQALVKKYQGRLLGFFKTRVADRSIHEDLVQETFVGLMVSLPNFREEEPLESYLFSIASFKLIDYYRRVGRQKTGDLASNGSGEAESFSDMPDDLRQVSSLMQSQERRDHEQAWLRKVLSEMINDWRAKGDFRRIKCLELIFVKGWPNRQVADYLRMSEPAVAGFKFQALARLRDKAPGR